MITVTCHQDVGYLPPADHTQIPVWLYGQQQNFHRNLATIGSPLIDPIRRLGVKISPTVFDFLTLALAVTAADTFVLRKNAADGWTREISLIVPLKEPEPWRAQKQRLEQTLHFLSGDIWNLDIIDGGPESPEPYDRRNGYKLLDLEGLDCVCLFSGGIDSTIGTIDLIHQGHNPLLVSHAYKGDKSRQHSVALGLRGQYSRFFGNAYPLSGGEPTEITMRTRSFNFFAFGLVGANAIADVNQLNTIDLYVSENGFISLNPPLATNRLGTLSTKTTHPYFLELLQAIFDNVGIQIAIRNPYQFKTKGEMIQDCASQDVLQSVISDTVSCSNWKRKRIQCGRCIPCLIRRAAIFAAGYPEQPDYLYSDLNNVFIEEAQRDDLFAVVSAISRLATTPINSWIMNSGPLPSDMTTRNAYGNVFLKGLQEVESYLRVKGIL